MVENSRIDIFTILVTLEIKEYNHRANKKLNFTCFNVIVRPLKLFP